MTTADQGDREMASLRKQHRSRSSGKIKVIDSQGESRAEQKQEVKGRAEFELVFKGRSQ